MEKEIKLGEMRLFIAEVTSTTSGAELRAWNEPVKTIASEDIKREKF